MRWAGFFRPYSAGEYTFVTDISTDAGWRERVRLWVDSKLLTNEWTSLSAVPATDRFSGTLLIPTANHYYDIFLEYAVAPEANTDRKILLRYDCCGDNSRRTIPSDRLFQAYDVAGSPFAASAHTS
mmetsp:Transcript_56427/g.122719  ORF Transcript_56427/g.122719 Transcript_56427/m.122719 type:complete len:126 (-) Transcript_56427:35-412(-)